MLNKSKLRNKTAYDKNINPIKLKINDKILLSDERRHKHEPIYKGPFLVKHIDSSNITILDPETQKTKIVHKNNANKHIRS